MRKGSTPLGSLGMVPAGTWSLILPLAAYLAGNVVVSAPVAAAPKASSKASLTSSQREALQRRQKWLRSSERLKTAAKATEPKAKKVIHTRATWYGPGFHGRRTASGERFNRHAMTLASRHLPMGTRVRVVNPKTGRSAIARVNDRGPFGLRGVTVDLSQGLARKIGLGGTGPVKIEVLAKR